MDCYAYAKLSNLDFIILRIGGPGLGNLLFPWARSVVKARTCNCKLIWPTWPQVKLGPLLRSEKDFRVYTNLFKPTDSYLSGVQKALIISKHLIPFIFNDQKELSNENSSSLFVYSGMNNMFQPILNHSEMLKEELLSIVHPDVKLPNQKELKNVIAVHIRMSDFVEYEEKKFFGTTGMRLPIEWYKQMIQQLSNNMIGDISFRVFSDGNEEELSPVLSCDNVTRMNCNSALGDLLAISMCKVLIGSNSTFSMWGSFLGQLPSIWFKGSGQLPIYPNGKSLEIEIGLNEKIPEEFIKKLN